MRLAMQAEHTPQRARTMMQILNMKPHMAMASTNQPGWPFFEPNTTVMMMLMITKSRAVPTPPYTQYLACKGNSAAGISDAAVQCAQRKKLTLPCRLSGTKGSSIADLQARRKQNTREREGRRGAREPTSKETKTRRKQNEETFGYRVHRRVAWVLPGLELVKSLSFWPGGSPLLLALFSDPWCHGSWCCCCVHASGGLCLPALNCKPISALVKLLRLTAAPFSRTSIEPLACVVGVILTTGSSYGVYGRESRPVVEYFRNAINRLPRGVGGTGLGIDIRYATCDDTPASARAAAISLLAQGVQFMIAPYSSDLSVAVALVTDPAKVVRF
jgi:ABC-type branched-subunit amino acid transport system substrate-binding protein